MRWGATARRNGICLAVAAALGSASPLVASRLRAPEALAARVPRVGTVPAGSALVGYVSIERVRRAAPQLDDLLERAFRLPECGYPVLLDARDAWLAVPADRARGAFSLVIRGAFDGPRWLACATTWNARHHPDSDRSPRRAEGFVSFGDESRVGMSDDGRVLVASDGVWFEDTMRAAIGGYGEAIDARLPADLRAAPLWLAADANAIEQLGLRDEWPWVANARAIAIAAKIDGAGLLLEVRLDALSPAGAKELAANLGPALERAFPSLAARFKVDPPSTSGVRARATLDVATVRRAFSAIP